MSKNIKAGFGFSRWRHGKTGGLVGQVKIYFLDARASGAIRVYTPFINAALPDYQVKLNVYVAHTPRDLQVSSATVSDKGHFLFFYHGANPVCKLRASHYPCATTLLRQYSEN